MVDSSSLGDAYGGCVESFAELVTRHRAQVVRLALHFTHDVEDANDIAQEAFLRAFRSRDAFDAKRDFKAWIFVIARRCALDSLRRKGRLAAFLSKRSSATESDGGPEDLVLRSEDAARLHEAIAALAPAYRDALELQYTHGLTYREIAVELNVPIGTVKTLIFRAKRRLKLQLDTGRRMTSAA